MSLGSYVWCPAWRWLGRDQDMNIVEREQQQSRVLVRAAVHACAHCRTWMLTMRHRTWQQPSQVVGRWPRKRRHHGSAHQLAAFVVDADGMYYKLL